MFSVCRGCCQSACIVTRSGPMSNPGSASRGTSVNTRVPPSPIVCARSVPESIFRKNSRGCNKNKKQSYPRHARLQQMRSELDCGLGRHTTALATRAGDQAFAGRPAAVACPLRCLRGEARRLDERANRVNHKPHQMEPKKKDHCSVSDSAPDTARQAQTADQIEAGAWS